MWSVSLTLSDRLYFRDYSVFLCFHASCARIQESKVVFFFLFLISNNHNNPHLQIITYFRCIRPLKFQIQTCMKLHFFCIFKLSEGIVYSVNISQKNPCPLVTRQMPIPIVYNSKDFLLSVNLFFYLLVLEGIVLILLLFFFGGGGVYSYLYFNLFIFLFIYLFIYLLYFCFLYYFIQHEGVWMYKLYKHLK